MNTLKTTCVHCLKPREFTTGYHDCPQAKDAKERLEAQIDAIKAKFQHPTAK